MTDSREEGRSDDELRSELEEKQRESSELRDEIVELKEALSERRGRSGNIVDLAEDVDVQVGNYFDPEVEVIVEEVGLEDGPSDYYFYFDGGGGWDAARIVCERFKGGRSSSSLENSVGKFLREEVEPAEVHEHGSGIRHRVWRLKEVEVMALNIISGWCEAREYLTGGWERIEEELEYLEEAARHPVICGGLEGGLEDRSMAMTVDMSFLFELAHKLVRYAHEHDLRLQEAVIALSLEDQDFAEKRDRARRRIEGRVEAWKRVLSHYLPGGGGDSG